MKRKPGTRPPSPDGLLLLELVECQTAKGDRAKPSRFGNIVPAR